jgi:hypothetical protein
VAQHVAYLVSFLTIGVIWLNHHRIFEQVARTASALYSGMLLVMGLAFGAVFAWVTHTDRLLHRLPPPAVVRAARLRFMFGWAVYTAAFGLSWVGTTCPGLVWTNGGVLRLDQASVPAAVELDGQRPPDGQPSWR